MVGSIMWLLVAVAGGDEWGRAMNGLDLFSGIGGLTLALAPWVRPIAYCENEPYAAGVLLSRMQTGDLPVAPIWDDVRTLKGSSFLQVVDIIYGGFPCQDISCAGRGAGLEGERSGLFFEIARLVDELRPSFIFLENVPTIFTRGFDRVLGAITARGYDARWCCLSASDVGAPHKRNRWWLLAYSLSDTLRKQLERDQETPWLETITPHDGAKGTLADSRRDRRLFERETHHDDGSDALGNEFARRYEAARGDWATEPDVGRVADGIPARVDRLCGLGNSVVPLQARRAFMRLSGLRGAA